MHQGRNNMHQYRLEVDLLESIPVGENMGVLIDKL